MDPNHCGTLKDVVVNGQRFGNVHSDDSRRENER